METYGFLLDLALILLSTKVLGLITKRFHMPQVVGALLAGVILGPACFGILNSTDLITDMAEIGVIVLMFCAGLETDVKELKKCGLASLIIAILGVIVPWVGGAIVTYIYISNGSITSNAQASVLLQSIFVGVILTATSVSITVETLREIGKLKTDAGNAILGAAIIDDVLGIVALTIVTSMADTSVSIGIVLLKILGFFVFAIVTGFIFFKLYKLWIAYSKKAMHRHAIAAFVFCLLVSFCAEVFFGVADITGAFIAGLFISVTPIKQFVTSKFDVLSYLLLSPIFFASIGLKVELPKMTNAIIAFSIILVVVAVLSKVIGCGIGAKCCKYTGMQSLRIGVGMISRGEVALIVANKGAAAGLLGDNFMGPIVLVVVATTIITPILLKPVFKGEPLKDSDA